MGRQDQDEISARELAAWGGTVCYDILAGWRGRLPRVHLDDEPTPAVRLPSAGQPEASP